MEHEAKSRLIYFTKDAQKNLGDIIDLTGGKINISEAVRTGLELYLSQLKKQNKGDENEKYTRQCITKGI